MEDIIKANDRTLQRYDTVNTGEFEDIDIIEEDVELEEAKEMVIEDDDYDSEMEFPHLNLQSPPLAE